MKGQHCLWVDNFSKMYKIALPDITTGTYTNANNTGIALIPFKLPDISMKTLKDQDGAVVPCLPKLSQLKQYMKDVIDMILNTQQEDKDALSASLVGRYDVNTIPLKLIIKDRSDPLRRKARAAMAKQNQLIPLEIRPYNIGSTQGLCQFWKEYFDEHVSVRHNEDVYRMCVCDSNIYWRTMKVKVDELFWCLILLCVADVLFSDEDPAHSAGVRLSAACMVAYVQDWLSKNI